MYRRFLMVLGLLIAIAVGTPVAGQAAKTGATIIGHETAANLARAYGVTDSSLITVIGGEDYEFDGFSLRVIPNIHSALDKKHYYNNTRGNVGTAPRGLRAPLRFKDYVGGGTRRPEAFPAGSGHGVAVEPLHLPDSV